MFFFCTSNVCVGTVSKSSKLTSTCSSILISTLLKKLLKVSSSGERMLTFRAFSTGMVSLADESELGLELLLLKPVFNGDLKSGDTGVEDDSVPLTINQ